MKKIKLITSLVLAISLVGCHSEHSNKLLTEKQDRAAKFLYEAQSYASTKTHLYDSVGSAYINCVMNPSHYDSPFNKSAKNPCKLFLVEMLNFSKNSKDFHTITLANLKDKNVPKHLQDKLIAYQASGGTNDET